MSTVREKMPSEVALESELICNEILPACELNSYKQQDTILNCVPFA